MIAFLLTLGRAALAPVKTGAARSIAELLESLIIAGVLVFMIVRPFFLQAFFIPTESMEPTLAGHPQGVSPTGATYPSEVHDHIFVNKLSFRLGQPSRGEIIVFRAPANADNSGKHQENVLIKRCVAVGGDTVQVKPDKDGTERLFVNDQPVNEPYIKEPMTEASMMYASTAVNEPLKLAPDQVFVMGDNRNNSNDGRFWGPLEKSRIIGRAIFVFWPLNRIGRL